ncbi:glycoside hydrolase family 3 protein [Paenibacillus sp. N1-5-1-14]|uniref:glycoside hydrolase family 3 protein n=1 Tax=Paenibacillus radicibacter TaxID=2972488 RepID=UPI002158FB34|nr:glycoside hydrolase family 3 N-terminal domain-containing protein [Paenibacillus radicibacter]MCR8642835.1 glycoside hydrolase family 3 protein [Paenibacillus radicibacter]
MINLKAKPFNLNDADIQWVEEKLQSLSMEAKIGQLFCPIGFSQDKQDLQNLIDHFQPGGIMYRPGVGAEVQETHRYLQDNSAIPLLIAANLEAGGNGIASDGTFFGKQMEVAATDNEEMGYRLGVVAGSEGSAVGCNWAFAPVIDIDMNFRNPITNIRTYGSDPERVLRMSKAYMKGIHEQNVAVSIKHFPGDGVDERDQHLHVTHNTLSIEEWDRTYGHIYKEMIEAGAGTVMIGHITMPAYSKALVPGMEDKDIMPATLAPELLNGLLREKLGFNGMIVTDASLMGGFTMAEKREIAVPKSIAAGCDMFLFNRDIREDYEFMRKGIENGILTMERVDEAVTRILALKASLGLHRKQAEGTLVPSAEALSVLKCEEHEQWAQECADQSVTLVKDTQSLLPLSVERHKRVLLFVLGDEAGHFGGEGTYKGFMDQLTKEGFEVELFPRGEFDFSILMQSVESLKSKYDLVLYYINLETKSNQTAVRVNFAAPFGADMPWFLTELPTVCVSVASPYHLQDLPQVKTYVNAYSASSYVQEAVVEKLLGRSPFKGVNPVDPFCDLWDTRL